MSSFQMSEKFFDQREGEEGMNKFSRNLNLPDYLESVLAPFAWSGMLSSAFKDSVLCCLIAPKENRVEVATDFIRALRLIKFLDPVWVEDLSKAMMRFAREGFERSKIKR